MNTEHWMKWYNKRVIPNLPDKSVFIVDNAKYHNQVTEESRRPTTAWRKADIQEWLTKHGHDFEQNEIKAELLKKVATIDTEKEFVTDKLAKESGKDIKILRIPIGHCELNPIELIWAWVKKQVSDRNKTFKIKDVEMLTKEVLDEVTPELWQSCVEHVHKVEQEYWKRDGLLDSYEVQPVVIDTSDDDVDDNDEELIQQNVNREQTNNNIFQILFGDQQEDT